LDLVVTTDHQDLLVHLEKKVTKVLLELPELDSMARKEKRATPESPVECQKNRSHKKATQVSWLNSKRAFVETMELRVKKEKLVQLEALASSD
jgi:hypothetical protein